ncbi:MAG: hypothetical protein SFX72_06730 [Isosphaeraceae bacterium]|nr:hypothetical protein [Isosphaeraceae bacterium]
MRKIRNPRYAPESLERKLFPSSFGLVAAVQVGATVGDSFTVDMTQDGISGMDDPDDPPPYDPPIPPPPLPPYEPPPEPPFDPLGPIPPETPWGF